MKLKINTQGITRKVGRKVLVVKKNSPHIFFVGGIVGVVGSTVLACRATLKLEEKLDDIKKDVDAVKSIKNGELEGVEASYKHFTYVSVKSIGVIGRLYGPSVLLGAASIAALTGSHVQLTRRNAALSATLAIVSKAYDDYRVRVQEEIGKEQELDIYNSVTEKEVEVDGKKKVVKVSDPDGRSPYARFFDASNVNWQNDSELNRMFIQCQQNYANHKLHARGHVFLNEVYDTLGFEHSSAGAVVGWVLDGDGDGYIDFGIIEAPNGEFFESRAGIERKIILDFNVDGVVYDKI